jgi:hypothetical protein
MPAFPVRFCATQGFAVGQGGKSTLSFRVISLVRNAPETAEILRDFPRPKLDPFLEAS